MTQAGRRLLLLVHYTGCTTHTGLAVDGVFDRAWRRSCNALEKKPYADHTERNGVGQNTASCGLLL